MMGNQPLDVRGQVFPLIEDESDKASSTTAHDVLEKQPVSNNTPIDQGDHMERNVTSENYEERVAQLARTFSHTSALTTSQSPTVNPFTTSDPQLDPSSPQFSAKMWARCLLHAFSQDPEKYPRHTVGVSFRDLSVHGFGSATDYQKDVANVLWQAPVMGYEWMSSRKSKIQILRNFDGLVKTGEVLLVLGRPGSGVSTLLKTISGQTHGLHLGEESKFNYQGIPWDIMHERFRGEVIYQAETDVHFPMLTVGQTLSFAALARTPRNRLDGIPRNTYATHLRDVVMTMFGLSHTLNTKVGDDFVRGVSGGERKRVSIAEVALNQSSIQCWDNSTRGLDSATALEFTKIVKLSTEVGQTAAIVAIYQASQPAYDIFDKVTLLYDGRQIYFGPATEAKQYFIDLGYHCPSRQTTADFLTSITNEEERIVRTGYEDRAPRTPDEFAEAWRKSSARATLIRDIEQFETDHPLGHVALMTKAREAQKDAFVREKSPYTLSVVMQVFICTIRGFQRLRGDVIFFLVTVFGSFLISVVLGSVFYDLPPTAESLNNRGILLFFAILFNALKSALEIFSLYAQRPIVEKHARYALYHPFSEALASTICDLPTKILSTITFNIPLYFMSNLRREAGPFFIFLLFGFLCTLTMSMILRTVGQTSRTIHQALTPTAVFILALVIYTGFILPTQNMQGWLRWLNYINPIAYAYESLMANEFSGRKFPCTQFVPMGPPYANATATERACTVPGAMPGQDFVDGDNFINLAYGYYQGHIWRNFGILIAYIVFFMITYVLAAEYVSMNISKGEVLVFRRKVKRGQLSGILSSTKADEETGTQGEIVMARDAADAAGATTPRVEENPMIHKQTAIFHWSDVCYDITIKGEQRRILDHVDGWVKPGTLTALMGATGAGKTTLLDVLADRVTMGVVSGDMCVNGLPRGPSFQRKTGYVKQQDLHLETSTVREALRFSAELRQPAETPLSEKHSYVEEVIGLLEMSAYAEAIIGVQGEGLNVEQRKRLSIGVELVAKPELLLFLDEPTSGLDSQTAWSVATLIRKLSDNGQAILCTIHQPSALLFQQFDRLLLLTKGGRTVFFGPIPDMINYFEKNGGPKCPPDANPADWMLEVIGAAPGAHTDVDWPKTWNDSEERRAVRSELESLRGLTGEDDHADEDDGSMKTYAAPFWRQFMIVTRRVFQQYWRTPSYIYSKLILSGGTSLFIGLSFLNAKLSIQGLQGQMFSIFMLLVIFAFLVYQTMPHFIVQRQLYEARERSSRTYSWIVFMLANMVVELPWNTLAALLIFFPFYYLVGMDRNAVPTDAVTERGGLMFLLIWLFMMYESTFTDMVIAGIDTSEVGATVALILFVLCLIFCGVMAPPSALPGFWIFMYRVSPFTYLVGAILATGVGNAPVQCSPIEVLRFQPPPGQTCGSYLAPFMQVAGGALLDPTSMETCQFCPLASTNTFLASVSTSYNERWRNVGIVCAYIFFNAVAAIGFYWLVRVPKKSGISGFLKTLRTGK